ncbi:BCCT family transporter [Roseibacterium beibuensis]|uniref:BCCT family transporter n=1 Tax=[Roseibacterium] beibuensis TaxID=1193142 RepID=UPI00217CC900|nr:BCCT family transporter [Roseibacterium beibuensis]MCS6627034.1 BCCT family transporter [Roseibacterium beibuensis]
MLKSKMNPRVFWGASLIIALLLLAAVLAPGASDYVFQAAQRWVIGSFGWFYIAAVAGFLLLVIGLAIAPTGRLKLGPDDCEPDFPYLSWLAMLFAAGMGIGLMYFAVAEPVQHYAAPPEGAPGTFAAAREAMVITFTHWGVHAWAIYALVGLSLAYFAHRKGLPLTLRSGLYPLLGRRTDGWIGDAVDIFAIWGTLFGIATSLGLGVAQINSGLNYLTGLPSNAAVQVGLIALVMGAATVSVLTGLDRGVRRLSELNLVLAVLLMVFVLAVGPTGFLFKALVQNFGLYLDHFFLRTFNMYAYEPRGWMADWTLFYWAWWIAWSPFVGMFIARISRGRTVREFIIGVLLVPTGFTFLWMTVFGNTAIALDMGQAAGAISQAVTTDLSTAIFRFFEYLPGAAITSTIAVLLVAVFFVTSADSGSLVIDTIASGGADDTPRWQRVYWCSLEGLAAAILLLAGGLGALQAATLVAALPFAAIMIVLAAGLVRQMNADRKGIPVAHAVPPIGERLKRILSPARRRDIDRQIEQHAVPALEAVRRALEAEGVEGAAVARDDDGVALSAPAGDSPFAYRLAASARPLPAFTALDAPEPRRTHEWRLLARVGPADRGRDVTGFTTDQLIADVLERLDQWRRAHRPA